MNGIMQALANALGGNGGQSSGPVTDFLQNHAGLDLTPGAGINSIGNWFGNTFGNRGNAVQGSPMPGADNIGSSLGIPDYSGQRGQGAAPWDNSLDNMTLDQIGNGGAPSDPNSDSGNAPLSQLSGDRSGRSGQLAESRGVDIGSGISQFSPGTTVISGQRATDFGRWDPGQGVYRNAREDQG